MLMVAINECLDVQYGGEFHYYEMFGREKEKEKEAKTRYD